MSNPKRNAYARPYYRPPDPGMGCAEGNGFPGEWRGGIYTKEPRGPGAENYFGWHPEEARADDGHAAAPRRMPKSISGRY